MNKTHNLKIYTEYADSVSSGDKNFEIRYNDRGYQKGDFIRFIVIDKQECEQPDHGLHGEVYEITYVHSGLGMEDGYVALAIKRGDEE